MSAKDTYEHFSSAAEYAEQRGQSDRSSELQFYADEALKRMKPEDLQETPLYTSSSSAENGIVANTVQPLPVPWGWPGRFLIGRSNWIFGKGGVGKGMFMSLLTACVTRGLPMPDGLPGMNGCVVLITPEDDIEFTSVPRLLAADADLSKVYFLNEVERDVTGTGSEASSDTFTLPDDVPALRKLIEKINQEQESPVSMVIIDPLMAVANDNVSLYRNQTVRRKVVGPLEALSEDLGICLVLVAHVNKGRMSDFLDNANGSKGITDAGRRCFGIVPDDKNPGVKVFFDAKNNVGPAAPPIAYKIVPVFVEQTGEYAGAAQIVSGYDASVLEAHRQRVASEMEQNIIEYLERVHRCVDYQTIHQKAGGLTLGATRTTLWRMVNKGVIAYPSRNHYCSLTFLHELQAKEEAAKKQAEKEAKMKKVETEKTAVITVTSVTNQPTARIA